MSVERQARLLGEQDEPGYQVALPVFEGPLDLLLHLIERQELDITAISLAQVTNQYLEYLAGAGERNPDNLADFLVVAAKLLLIKSRVLLPQPPAPPAAEEDQGDDLVRQLVEYKRFKEAARWLQQQDEQGLRSYVRLAAMPDLERSADLGEVSLDDLLAAVREVLAVKPAMPHVDQAVAPMSITIGEQMDHIERRLADGRVLRFQDLFEGAAHRLEVIVTLLALLEMIKQLRVQVRQERMFGEILVEKREVARKSESGQQPI
ncbi:MAG: segregation/condensation protein A [Anaerolineae bacterium]|jgi:segregation and condensation protein A|nr:segregation/condensation protein A [Anaerolineae bacterium]